MITYPLPLSYFMEVVKPRQLKQTFFVSSLEEQTALNMINAAIREGDSYPDMPIEEFLELATSLGYEIVYKGPSASLGYKYGLLLGAIHPNGFLESANLYGGPRHSDDVLIGLKYIDERIPTDYLSEPFNPIVVKMFANNLADFSKILPYQVYTGLFDL